jgi:hypothetical protein
MRWFGIEGRGVDRVLLMLVLVLRWCPRWCDIHWTVLRLLVWLRVQVGLMLLRCSAWGCNIKVVLPWRAQRSGVYGTLVVLLVLMRSRWRNVCKYLMCITLLML